MPNLQVPRTIYHAPNIMDVTHFGAYKSAMFGAQYCHMMKYESALTGGFSHILGSKTCLRKNIPFHSMHASMSMVPCWDISPAVNSGHAVEGLPGSSNCFCQPETLYLHISMHWPVICYKVLVRVTSTLSLNPTPVLSCMSLCPHFPVPLHSPI